ncbi:pyridoxal-5'-phosphate-dependent protein [Rhizobium sp. R72]|uniref:D-cysteine desulfhydrase family protein n=1 Tax=unclassified Rhizobium TaxID=2613769 RepID=UPI000B531571|nr:MULTISPECIES: D-cysteine desulfhydrase family protein [unclassified Rhizobium]OWW05179.1 pyridoxal-5'-phosphate-dependent protein [Rhizobium sp. R72]OWW06236.1 pyridoxal-5'-phosphate-dependent protein [Rhizobium sp. R711]
MQLDAHPRQILSQWPTPIETLDRLSAAYGGPRISIKRDDFGSIAMGGNKLRKLEYLMGDALAKGCDTVVTSGALQSNHARLTAAVATKLGLRCHLVLKNEVPDRSESYHNSANLLLDRLVGAEIVQVGRNDPLADAVDAHAASLRAQGLSPYVVPLGGSNAIGCLGYVTCAVEIAEQERKLGKAFSHIFVVSGSGGTHAGLLAGLKLTGSTAKLVGATISRSKAMQRPLIEQLVSDVAPLVGIHESGTMDAIELDDSMYLPGYGLPNDPSRKAVVQCARSEGILLDPVYTSKAMAALFSRIEAGIFKPSDEVLFIHTGGAPALFAYDEIYAKNPL